MEEPPEKRPRLEPEEDNLFHEAHRKNATDLLKLTTCDTGNLEARIQMVFPRLGGTRQLNLETDEHGNKHRFLVVLASKVVDKLGSFPFHPGDMICISLKGAQIGRRKDSSSPFYLPVVLTFKDGLAVMLMSGPESGKVFNTWEVDWFDATLDIPRVTDMVMHDASTEYVQMPNIDSDPSTVAHIPQPETVSERLQEDPVFVSHEHSSSSPVANIPGAQLQTKELTKAQRRRRRRKERVVEEPEAQAALEDRPKPGGHEIRPPQAETRPSRAQPLPPNSPSNERTSLSSERTASLSSEKSNPITVTIPSLPDRTSYRREGASAINAGLVIQGGDEFTAIREIEPGLINIIGVVVSTKPLRPTRTNEWTRTFSLIDPSCVEDGVGFVDRSFTVNCFQKKYTEWLPQAEIGDIILFRSVKATVFGGSLNGIGYWDKLRWVTYDPHTRRFRDPDRKNVPHSETSGEGFGYSFSPFYESDTQDKEAEYCAQLADWWQEMQAKDYGVTTIQCIPPCSREHHLISEVTPDTSPQGYFDCTVEILHGFENDDGPYTMYVTDYTANPHTYPLQASWCPPELSTYIFRLEMWDMAKTLAQTMQPGEFWYLTNARMMAKTYFEGKLVEAHKSQKLDESQSEENPHLRALLERKKKYERRGGKTDSSAKFDHKLIEDVDEDVRFFSCTVEVLHVDLASAEEPLVYVTDYTFHPALVNPSEPAPWALGLDRLVVKIVLEGGQKGRARDLQPGAIYRINNLRLIRRTNGNDAFGRLGGDERLIIEVKDREKGEVEALLQRKEKWTMEMKRDGLSIELAGNPPITSRPPTAYKNLTLKEVIANVTCPNKFTFVARVTDFNPLFLDEATFLWCTKCKTELRRSWKRCVECDDMLDTHCKWLYGLFFRLEDDEGDHIIVSVSEKECELLSGLPPTDLQADTDAFDRLVARLKPIIGNLREVHDGYLKKAKLLVATPNMRFTVESWNEGGRRGYGLLECTPL